MSSRSRFLRRQLPTFNITSLYRVRSLARIEVNSTWLLLARIVVQVQTLLLTLLVARRLGEAAFGQFSLISAVLFLGNVFTTFGTDTLLIRRVAQVGETDLPEIQAVLSFQLLFSALAVGAVWLWTAVAPLSSPQALIALRLYSLSLFPLAFFSVFSAILRGLERMDLALLVNLGTAAMQLFAAWLAFQAWGGLIGLMGALLGVQIFAAAFSCLLCRAAARPLHLHWSVDLSVLPRLLRLTLPLAVISILGVAYQRLGIFALSYLKGDEQTGAFSAAARVVEALKLVHIAVLGALLPALSRLLENPGRGAEARHLIRKTTWALLGAGFLGAAGASQFAGPLVTLLYKTQYGAAIPALHILSWVLVPYSLTSVFAVELVAERREKLLVIALGISLLAAAGLSLWWIPLNGITGASAAIVAAEGLQGMVLWGLMKKRSQGS